MALFKISKGLKANLPSTKTEGYCYYTTDDSLFYIDYKDSNGTLQRKAINAQDAETLTGASLATILNSSDIEIPTSKAVLDALASKANSSHNHDDIYYTELEIDTKVSGIMESIDSTNQAVIEHTADTTNPHQVTAEQLGIYVQDSEPTDAAVGAIWIDTASSISNAEEASF